MQKPTPLQRVKAKFGGKEALVAQLVDLLEPAEGESKEDFARRLKLVANAKLLHLLELGEKIKVLGGRAELARKVAELRGHANDRDFIAKLETRTAGQLLDAYESLSRRQRKAAKA